MLACGIAWVGRRDDWQPCPALVLAALPGLLGHSSHCTLVLHLTGRAMLRSLLAVTLWGEGTPNRHLLASGTATGQQMDALCLSSRLIACLPLGTNQSFPRRQTGMWGLQPPLQAGTLKPVAALQTSHSPSSATKAVEGCGTGSSSLLRP